MPPLLNQPCPALCGNAARLKKRPFASFSHAANSLFLVKYESESMGSICTKAKAQRFARVQCLLFLVKYESESIGSTCIHKQQQRTAPSQMTSARLQCSHTGGSSSSDTSNKAAESGAAPDQQHQYSSTEQLHTTSCTAGQKDTRTTTAPYLALIRWLWWLGRRCCCHRCLWRPRLELCRRAQGRACNASTSAWMPPLLQKQGSGAASLVARTSTSACTSSRSKHAAS